MYHYMYMALKALPADEGAVRKTLCPEIGRGVLDERLVRLNVHALVVEAEAGPFVRCWLASRLPTCLERLAEYC